MNLLDVFLKTKFRTVLKRFIAIKKKTLQIYKDITLIFINGI